MSMNNKLDRRHDINAGEMLPQRLTRVQDMELYWDGIERVLSNDENVQLQAQLKELKDKAAMELEAKKASIKAGDIVLLLWSGVQVVKVNSVGISSVRIGPNHYGWELIKKPSEAFLKALEAEGVEL